MTVQNPIDVEHALDVLLAAAAEYARVTIGSHDKNAEIIDRFGENLVLGVDLGRSSVALSGRNPNGALTFILGTKQPDPPKFGADERD